MICTDLYRKLLDDNKIKIIEEVSINDVSQTLRKYGIGQSLFYKWKRAFINNGITLLKDKHRDSELIRLQYENAQFIADLVGSKLKTLVGEKGFELKIKNMPFYIDFIITAIKS